MIPDPSLYTAIAASGLASAVLSLALWYLSTVPDAPDVTRWWAAGFLVNTLRHVIALGGPWMDPALTELGAEAAQAVAGILILAGALRFAGWGGRQGWVLAAIPLTVVWAALFTLVHPSFLLEAGPLYGLSGLAMLYAGWLFLRQRPPYRRSAHLLVGGSFILWGLHKLDYPLLRPMHEFAVVGYMMAGLFSMLVAVGLIMLVQRRQQFQAEQARLQAQASQWQLQTSEARYRDLIENSVQGVVISRGNHVLYANPASARMFGYGAPDELTAHTLADLADPGEVERLRGYLLARREGRSAPQRYEFKARQRDGAPLWIDCTVRVVDWAGRPASQATLSDITEKRQMEEALRSHQRLLRTVVDSVPHVIIVRDREGRMLMANRAWAEAFGRDPERYLGQTAQELDVHPHEEGELLHRNVLNVVQSELPVSHEHVVTVRQGPRRFYTIRTPLRGEGGRVVGVVSISLDITEQRTMEEQLRQAQKMEAVGQLTGGVAHDFNNLLSVIMGNLELLQARVGADQRALTYAGRAVRATERGAALTQRLLTFSRRQKLQPQPLDLRQHVQGLLDLLRSSVGETIRVEAHLDPEPCEVRVDPNQLENALLNLVLNARDAMPGGGRLHIEVRPVSAGAVPGLPPGPERPHDWVKMAVSDDGAGMPSGVVARAVEPFFTTKDPGSGSGLGLSMVYGFMDQSGGHMGIHSDEGEGTRVELFFQRIRGAEAPQDEAAGDSPAPLRALQTVLVVEDDPGLGHLAVEMLSELNCTAIRAMDAREALQTLRENPQVALLFTDIVLPNGMDGVMLAREARRLRPGLKVLFTSGFAETVFERHPLELGEAELVQKPYRLSDLANKLSRVLGRRISVPA